MVFDKAGETVGDSISWSIIFFCNKQNGIKRISIKIKWKKTKQFKTKQNTIKWNKKRTKLNNKTTKSKMISQEFFDDRIG